MNAGGRRAGFIGVGVQKAGTTWIHRHLAAHPALFVATGRDKDTQFFSGYYDRGYQWYESHFGAATGDQLAGEVSTSYFYDSDAPARIREYNPDIRLFVCLRNPVERVISNHRHEARQGHISGANLDLGNALKNNPAYLLQSRYAEHLERWLECFGQAALRVLFFDDLVADPAGFMRGLYGFLGVDTGFLPGDLEQRANVSRVPAYRGLENAVTGAGRALRRAGLGRLVAAGRRLGVNDWLRRANTVRDESAVVSVPDAAIDEIREALRPDIERLAALTGRDLRAWLD